MSHAVLLACGNAAAPATLAEAAGMTVYSVPARPTREVVDPVLAELAGRRLAVAGSDADLAAVVLRLVRTERLADVEVIFVPDDPDSVCARRWGLPGAVAAIGSAHRGALTPVPVVRDDSGGVLLGLGVLEPVDGVGYCDDETVLRGLALRIEVHPEPGPGLAVRVIRRARFGRTRAHEEHGRALQIGCAPLRPVYDGVTHPRPVQRWTWYRHTEDLRLVRPT
ncbi:MAG: hypothetical protein ACRDQ5_17890 [Sciscionella sp.]